MLYQRGSWHTQGSCYPWVGCGLSLTYELLECVQSLSLGGDLGICLKTWIYIKYRLNSRIVQSLISIIMKNYWWLRIMIRFPVEVTLYIFFIALVFGVLSCYIPIHVNNKMSNSLLITFEVTWTTPKLSSQILVHKWLIFSKDNNLYCCLRVIYHGSAVWLWF